MINVPSSQWTHAFALPVHFTVGPTASEPYRGAADLRPAPVPGLPLPLAEDFGPDGAFGGKCFVRMPRRPAHLMHVSGPVARLRSDQPAFGSQSMWLPDYCVLGELTLVQAAAARRAPKSAASLRGLGASKS